MNNLKKIAISEEKIDNLIQEMRFSINHYNDLVLEWIPYNQFNNIISKGDSNVYSAIWKDGPLYYDERKMNYSRMYDKQIALKYLCNSQNATNEFLLNEV